jgi:hypothetical protein
MARGGRCSPEDRRRFSAAFDPGSPSGLWSFARTCSGALRRADTGLSRRLLVWPRDNAVPPPAQPRRRAGEAGVQYGAVAAETATRVPGSCRDPEGKTLDRFPDRCFRGTAAAALPGRANFRPPVARTLAGGLSSTPRRRTPRLLLPKSAAAGLFLTRTASRPVEGHSVEAYSEA